MSEKYNFLFIITDQQRKDHLSCYNDKIVLKTPNIDRIAKEGVRFTNFYCNNPICMPNRSTIYTGQYPSIHGVTTNGRNLPQGTKTFVEILLERGNYHTASFGKIHLNYFGVPDSKFFTPQPSQEFLLSQLYEQLTHYSPYFGLQEVKLISGHGNYIGHPDYINWALNKIKLDENLQAKLKIRPSDMDTMILRKMRRLLMSLDKRDSYFDLQVWKTKVPEDLYSTTFVKENVIEFLERFANGHYSKKNFFVFCSFPDPHHPYTPPGKYFNMYKPENINLPENFNDNHEKSPKFIKNFYEGALTEGEIGAFDKPKDIKEIEAKCVIAGSYGTEKMIDDAVGEILRILDKTELAENTIIIYTTDHGELGGDHNLFLKGPYLYQSLASIPFIIKIPKGLKNRVYEHLASSIDIPETILELAGIPIPNFMQGKSLVPALNDTEQKINDDVLIEMDAEEIENLTRTLIVDDWRITVSTIEINDGELYNLREDPLEMNNLWNDERHLKTKNNLVLKLLEKIILSQRSPIKRDCSF